MGNGVDGPCSDSAVRVLFNCLLSILQRKPSVGSLAGEEGACGAGDEKTAPATAAAAAHAQVQRVHGREGKNSQCSPRTRTRTHMQSESCTPELSRRGAIDRNILLAHFIISVVGFHGDRCHPSLPLPLWQAAALDYSDYSVKPSLG